MPCAYCHKPGHNRKTCGEYLNTISAGLCCPKCECDFNQNPFAMLNCGHPMCLECVINMGVGSGDCCVDCITEESEQFDMVDVEFDAIPPLTPFRSQEQESPPTSPSKSSDIVEVTQHGVLYCRRTNTYIYNRVRFNTLRAAINCRKAHLLIGNPISSVGKGVYIYNSNSYNSLETLRRAHSMDITEFVTSNGIGLCVGDDV